VFRLGRLIRTPRGPGLVFLIPLIDRMVRIDLRTVTLTVPPQEVITRDNVPVRVNAVAYFRVIDPIAAVVEVEKFLVATSQIAQTTLRSTLGQHPLDEPRGLGGFGITDDPDGHARLPLESRDDLPQEVVVAAGVEHNLPSRVARARQGAGHRHHQKKTEGATGTGRPSLLFVFSISPSRDAHLVCGLTSPELTFTRFSSRPK
jgi:hypothetical protein